MAQPDLLVTRPRKVASQQALDGAVTEVPSQEQFLVIMDANAWMEHREGRPESELCGVIDAYGRDM